MGDKMKCYKNIEILRKRLLKNNGKKVNCWEDDGIKVNKKIFKLISYGGKALNSFVCFERKEGMITINYKLLKENEKTRTHDIFEFVNMWSYGYE